MKPLRRVRSSLAILICLCFPVLAVIQLVQAISIWSMVEINSKLLSAATDKVQVVGLGQDGTFTTANGDVWEGAESFLTYPGTGVWFVGKEGEGILTVEMAGMDFWTLGAIGCLVLVIMYLLFVLVIWRKDQKDFHETSVGLWRVLTVLLCLGGFVLFLESGVWFGVALGTPGALWFWGSGIVLSLVTWLVVRAVRKRRLS